MERQFRVLTATIALVATVITVGALPASASSLRHCTAVNIYTSCPNVSASPTSGSKMVELRGSASNSVSVKASEPSRALDAKSGERKILSASEIQSLVDEQCYGGGHCSTGFSNGLNALILPTEPGTPTAPGDAAPARVVTIADVERFVPAVAQLHAEPDGWAVVGVPSNFWTVVGPVVVDGELLGETAQVRFSPQLYRWDYGDGTGRTTRTGGASWSDLAQQELTATATSHVYAEKTAVEATVAVIWSAEYRIADGDWIPVAGAVSSTAPGADLLVVHERTVLTAG